MTVHQYVVRLAPITSQPILVEADSLRDGQLKAIIGNESKIIGIDWFRASEPVTPDVAHKIVQEYAKQHGIDEHSILVRSRLPKSNIKARKTNDSAATNLTLVKNEEKAAETKELVDGNNLTAMAQALQDAHNKRKDDVKPEPVKEEQKASADKPHGATVKRTEQEKKPRRAYQKKDKERSAKSKAAYERYLKEISAASAESPTFMEAAKPGPGVSEADVDEATLQFALRLAKLLKGVM